ncbi:hypothetical protein N9W41_00260 [bacterium]|nr:hypothetical protein [bacterium]
MGRVSAEESLSEKYKLPSSFGISLSSDNVDTRTTSLYLDYALESKDKIQVGFSGTKVDELSASTPKFLTSSTFFFNYNFDPMEVWSYSVGASLQSSNGSLGEFHNNSIDLGMVYAVGDWELSGDLYLRSIIIESSLLPPKFSRLRKPSSGVGVSATYLGLKSWEFSFGLAKYSYDGSLDNVSGVYGLIINNDPVLASELHNLTDKEGRLSAYYNFWKMYVGLDLVTTTTKIDQETFNSSYLTLGYNINKSYQVSLQVGSSRNPQLPAEKSKVTNLSLTYSW